MSKYFFMPSVSAMGIECLKEVPSFIKENNFKKALIVTDKVLVQIGLVNKVTDLLESNNVEYSIYDETKPNPTVKNVEEDIIKMQIELMQEGLQKTLAQMRYEREKRIQEAKKSGRKVAEQISLINRLYEKKEFEATQAYYKKQLDALKKFESDRENIIQSNDQRKIENSTTAAENKMNEPWNANLRQKYNFAQTYINSRTSINENDNLSSFINKNYNYLKSHEKAMD